MPRYRAAYSIFPRTLPSGVTVYYYRTYDADGRRTTARSTGKTSPSAARAYCDELLRAGTLVPDRSATLKSYTADWWLWDRCRYIRSLRARDPDGISPEHAANRRSALTKHTWPYLGSKRIGEITTPAIERWIDSLLESGLSPSSVRNTVAGLRTILREAVRRGDISRDPTEGARIPTDRTARRGILSREEARALFSPDAFDTVWRRDYLYFAANLLAAACGLRQGEIRGLRVSDVKDTYLEVRHGYGRIAGLKETKTRRARAVPLPAFVRRSLEPLLSGRSPDAYVVSRTGAEPIGYRSISTSLGRALEAIGIDAEERRARKLTFHSWRAFYVSFLRAAGVPDARVMAASGHSTTRMADWYTRLDLSHLAGLEATISAEIAYPNE